MKGQGVVWGYVVICICIAPKKLKCFIILSVNKWALMLNYSPYNEESRSQSDLVFRLHGATAQVSWGMNRRF